MNIDISMPVESVSAHTLSDSSFSGLRKFCSVTSNTQIIGRGLKREGGAILPANEFNLREVVQKLSDINCHSTISLEDDESPVSRKSNVLDLTERPSAPTKVHRKLFSAPQAWTVESFGLEPLGKERRIVRSTSDKSLLSHSKLPDLSPSDQAGSIGNGSDVDRVRQLGHHRTSSVPTLHTAKVRVRFLDYQSDKDNL